MHNTISLNGAYYAFEFPESLIGLHYQIAAQFGENLRIFGSRTALVSIDMYGGFTPETPDDFHKPRKPEGVLDWILVDSTGALKDKLHYFRRSEYCRDVAVLMSEATPDDYVEYLKERNYDYFVAGTNQVDLKQGLALLIERFEPESTMIDSGKGLTNALLNQGLVDKISLLVLPTITGKELPSLFGRGRKGDRSYVEEVANISRGHPLAAV